MFKQLIKAAVGGLAAGFVVGFGISKLRNAEKKEMENAFEKRYGLPDEKEQQKKQ